jgi:hypothetical protein
LNVLTEYCTVLLKNVTCKHNVTKGYISWEKGRTCNSLKNK